ncbi:MAG TPA: fibronectin type III domain-containing protein, partial [Candidatus Dormibacteraeota bacterium]
VYHFRLKAANADGPIIGDDETLQTLGPVIAGVWSEDVVFTEVTLKAEVNPAGVASTAHFEWGTTTAYGNESPESAVGSDSENHELSVFLEGLKPATTYHYRVVATSSDGVNESADHTFTTREPFAPNTNCANQQFRTGPGANLPDCRAYEMVSPVDKGGRGILAGTTQPAGHIRAAFDKAASDGNGITYTSATAFGDAVSNLNANQYLSRRGAEGWTTHGISAARPGSVLIGGTAITSWGFDTQFQLFTEDLSEAWVRDASDPPLTPDAVEGFGNFYRRDNTNDTYHEPVLTAEPLFWNEGDLEAGIVLGGPAAIEGMKFKGRSTDDSHDVFEADAQLTADAAETLKTQIYDRSGGELHLVSVMPGGEANPENSWVGGPISGPNESSGQARGVANRAVSKDGSHIFWTAQNPNAGNTAGWIYVRVDGVETVPISETVTPKAARFVTADTDGSKAIFSFDPDDTGAAEQDLYEFDVDTETPTLIAHNVTAVPGTSEDLSRLYFVSRDALAAGAIAGEENLYLDHDGAIRFIATLDLADVTGVTGTGALFPPSVSGKAGQSGGVDPRQLGVRVTPDGSHLAFMSRRPLTGYDNTDAVDGKADIEVFLYDADADQLTCVSCNPSGARPHGGGTRTPAYFLGKPEVPASGWRTAAWIPPSEQEQNTSRLLSDDGNRLFFNAVDALVPQDTNGVQDVYQWEAQGTGTCQKAGGCISLISTGKSSTYSEFIDASADGSDVFIRTESSIDVRDTGLMDIYDARVGGGFPPPPPPPPPCAGDACQSAPPPPNDPTPASAAFKGAGDPKPKKAQRRCRARDRHAAKGKRHTKKQAKACKRAKRGTGR